MCLLSLMVSYLCDGMDIYICARARVCVCVLSMGNEEGENMKRGDKIYFGKLNYSWPFRQSGISYFE